MEKSEFRLMGYVYERFHDSACRMRHTVCGIPYAPYGMGLVASERGLCDIGGVL